QCVRSRKDPYFPVDIGHRVNCICHMANISIKLGRKLKWDPVAETFVGDPQAVAMMDRPRRDPWQLPTLP
ncbi:MAG: gfo/Idh/MocA family oxidoreductase, partial [Akkermansiaceae bacterium]|nr:gfo/Idh/MocA family oxidoreductase [Akkermansiaceae bacterium]